MKVIRVLQVIKCMNLGGAETFIMNVYRNIDKSKIQFDFLVSGDGKYDEEIKKLGGKIYKIPYLTEVGQFRYVKELTSFFELHPEYTTIHSHIDQVSGIIVETAKKCNIKNVISHSHCTKNSNSIIGKIYKRYLQNKINKNTTIKLACGDDAAKWLYKKKANEAIVVKNGVDVKKFLFNNEFRKKIRKELGVQEETILIGHIGRFSEQKNHKFLIEIFNEYNKNHNTLLVLVGEGELQEKIMQQAERLNLQENVKFLGPRTDVHEIYSALDLIVFPSLYEGLSLVLVEAQCNGLKILASDVIDSNTDLTGNIILEDLKKDAQIWAKTIENLELKRDNEVKEKIEANGYNIEDVAKKMEKIYLGEYSK